MEAATSVCAWAHLSMHARLSLYCCRCLPSIMRHCVFVCVRAHAFFFFSFCVCVRTCSCWRGNGAEADEVTDKSRPFGDPSLSPTSRLSINYSHSIGGGGTHTHTHAHWSVAISLAPPSPCQATLKVVCVLQNGHRIPPICLHLSGMQPWQSPLVICQHVNCNHAEAIATRTLGFFSR